MSLILALMDHVENAPDRLAIVDKDGHRLTYRELEDESSARAAAWKDQGIGVGSKVLVAIRPSIPFYVSLLALWRLGAAAVFPEPFAGLAGVRHAAREIDPDAILSEGLVGLLLRLVPETAGIGKRLVPSARSPCRVGHADISPDQPALYSFTGGTTGIPKCIERSHRFMLMQNKALASLLASEDDVDLVWFPVFVFACLAAGSTAVLPDSDPRRPGDVDATALRRQIDDHGVTRLLAPPAVVSSLARSGVGVSTVLTGGGPVFPRTMLEISRMTDGGKGYVVYGSTEAEPISVLDLDEVDADDLSAMCDGHGLLAGRPIDDIQLRLVDDEILVAGAHVVESYTDRARNDGIKVEMDGRIWHRTGDGGRLDERGRLWLRGRTSARVKGLWPFEIEAMVRDWDGVEDAVLGEVDGRSVLGIVGDGDWPVRRLQGKALGIDFVVRLRGIPLDRRHGSRIDYKALSRLLADADL